MKTKSWKNGDVFFSIRCKPWQTGGAAVHEIQVTVDGTVRVKDDVSGHYTRCHSLPLAVCDRFRAMAEKRRGERKERPSVANGGELAKRDT